MEAEEYAVLKAEIKAQLIEIENIYAKIVKRKSGRNDFFIKQKNAGFKSILQVFNLPAHLNYFIYFYFLRLYKNKKI